MMLCPFCNGLRPANNAPCPLCNAPSPLVNDAWGGQNASFSGNASGLQNRPAFEDSWGGPTSAPGQAPFPQNSWQDPAGSGVQQLAFPMPGQQAFAQPPDAFWPQASFGPTEENENQSLLPAPYQGQQGSASQALMVLPTGFPTIAPGVQAVNSMLPALPDADQEAPVYVPPMYTKPRPVIPRYRAVSGLLSVLIVCALLCGGAGYYAQVTGKLTFFEKLLGNYAPPSVNSTQHTLQVPSNQVVYTANPASKIIYSVGISTSVNHGIIPTLVNQFNVGQTIWLVCSATSPKQAGAVNIKWYTNDHFYRLSTSDPIQANKSVTAVFNIIFAQPAEGKAEIYWNDQLAATVLFVVEPVV